MNAYADTDGENLRPRKLRILLADENVLLREGIRLLFEEQTQLTVVGEVGNFTETAILVARHTPDIIIMDIDSPCMGGVDTIKIIVREEPSIRVLALSRRCKTQHVLEVLRAGAKGFLNKQCSFEEVVRAVLQMAAGNIYLSTPISQLVLKRFIQVPEAGGECLVLTGREKEVLKLVTDGKTTREIAAYLELSVKTVETHRCNIMEKLSTRSLAGLVKQAIRMGISTLGIAFISTGVTVWLTAAEAHLIF